MLVSRALDWFRQALKDLEHAKKSLDMGHYEWACFASHQAAEKAVKALYQELGIEIWGHSVSKMLESLPEEHKPEESLINLAKELDRHYIPTGYPNSHPEGAPMDYYTRMDAEKAISCAEKVINFVRNKTFQNKL